MAIRGPGFSGPTPKTLPMQATMAVPSEMPAASMAGERMTPRTPMEFWSQRMAQVAPAAQSVIGDKRFELPRLGRRGAGRGEAVRRNGMSATIARPAEPAADGLAHRPLMMA